MDIWNIYEEKYLILFLKHVPIYITSYTCMRIADYFFVKIYIYSMPLSFNIYSTFHKVISYEINQKTKRINK